MTIPGTTISNIALDGSIVVEADNTTIVDSDIVVKGSQARCNSPCGGKGIIVDPGVTGTVIDNVTCHGGARTGPDVTEFCIESGDASTRVSRVHFYNCTTCMFGGATWSDNYVDQTGAVIPQEHYEDIYFGGGGGPLTVDHNTMLNPHPWTAVVFTKTDRGNIGRVTITNNLMAGGGYVLYGGEGGTAGAVRGPVIVANNRFSRLYFRNGGYWGTGAYFNNAVTTWSGNVWDNTLRPVRG